jgi:Skp family chaperone for outer membrane proteins
MWLAALRVPTVRPAAAPRTHSISQQKPRRAVQRFYHAGKSPLGHACVLPGQYLISLALSPLTSSLEQGHTSRSLEEKSMRWIAVALALTVMLSITSRWQNPATLHAEPSPAQVAVVDIRKLFLEHGKVSGLEEQVRSHEQRIEEETRTRIEACQSELAALEAQGWPSDDPVYLTKQRKVREKIALAQAEHSWALQQARNEVIASYERIYNEILAAIAAHARDHAIDFVLRADEVPAESPNASALIQKINRTALLYSARRFDITDAILRRLRAPR